MKLLSILTSCLLLVIFLTPLETQAQLLPSANSCTSDANCAPVTERCEISIPMTSGTCVSVLTGLPVQQSTPNTTPTPNTPGTFNDSAYRNAAKSVFIPDTCTGDQANNECSVCDILQLLVNVSRVILALTGVAAVLMLILAGFLFITAYGDTSRISQGKEIIKAVIVGVFVIMIAWTLVNTVIISLTNGKFDIPKLVSGNLGCQTPASTTAPKPTTGPVEGHDGTND